MSRIVDDEREHDPFAGMDPVRRQKWIDEINRRIARMDSGEDRELTLEEFWSDEEDD